MGLSVATHDGTCLMTPPSDSLKTILSTLGGAVQCESEKIMTAMMIPACLMGPYYRVLQQNRDWMVANGVPEENIILMTNNEETRDGFEHTLYLVRGRIAVELDALSLLKGEDGSEEAYFASFSGQQSLPTDV